ncbi:hypothetical protein Mnod_2410 [Methylobacterium nodulans ORS 2060]|uniref:Uncharacterized protein n=1 Tax=Methylobacterium nodulans (strain LMG 21967 / CNCM I-2342 / ORS 2060) TaxID=460265 RepID=B8IBG6_METNO|nr:hypothetical protein Mnod_2410 [Methylobacterium nodulans ORS 2060]
MAANPGPHAEALLAIEDRTEPLAGISRHARLTAGPRLWRDGSTGPACFEAPSEHLSMRSGAAATPVRFY